MATKPEFKYAPMFQLGEDKTEYRLLTKEGVTTAQFEGKEIVKVSREALTLLAQQAFHDVEFMLRREHNLQVAAILNDPEASENDKYVALQFLRNAEVAAKGILPFCQDTGTAIIHGEKGQQIWTEAPLKSPGGGSDEEALSLGVYNTFTEDNLRYSQNAPLTMYDEVNTRCNLPAQIDIEACEGAEYHFVMVAKGGGSANKTYFYPMTKATIQNEGTLLPFLVEKMKSLGTAACPPYHIAFVIGGTSAEKNLLTVKLASIKYYDSLPTTGDETGRAFRDIDLRRPSPMAASGARSILSATSSMMTSPSALPRQPSIRARGTSSPCWRTTRTRSLSCSTSRCPPTTVRRTHGRASATRNWTGTTTTGACSSATKSR